MVLRRSMGGDEALAPDLWLLERDTFDIDKYIRSKCPAMSEKGVKKLRQELIDLKHTFVDFSRHNVHADYKCFIRATRDISGLETSLFKVRNLLSAQVAIIHGLLEHPHVSTDPNTSIEEEVEVQEEIPEEEEYVASAWEKRFVALLGNLEILLAERKIEDAVLGLKEGEKLFAKHGAEEPNAASLRVSLSSMRESLVEGLIESTKKPSVPGAELRAVCSVLERLGEGPRAHSLLLVSHNTRLLHRIKGLRRTGSSYGGAYTAELSQLVFSAIAQALKDSVVVFGGRPSYASELMIWARQVTEKFVVLLKKYVLSSSAAAGGLRAAAECVLIALGHCALLEKEGLALSPFLSSLLKPSVEQAVSANLKRIGESTLALAAADNWSITDPLHDPRAGRRASYRNSDGVQLRLSNSAHMFNAMIEDFLGGVASLVSFQLASSVFEALSQVYEQYVSFLIKAMPVSDASQGSREVVPDRNLKTAETLSQQLVLLGNASALANEVLPSVARKLTQCQLNLGRSETNKLEPSEVKEKEWRLYLQQFFENLKSTLCKKLTRDIIFDRQGNALLTSQIYSNSEDEDWYNDPLPTPVFQALFSKVIAISRAGEEVLRGQEKLCNLLITEVLLSVVTCILNNEDFWHEMEEAPNAFTPLGLQKFVLDMQFIVQFTSQEHYTSDTMYKVIADNIARATNAFALNEGDPMSVLPDDKWFLEASQAAYQKLLAKLAATED